MILQFTVKYSLIYALFQTSDPTVHCEILVNIMAVLAPKTGLLVQTTLPPPDRLTLAAPKGALLPEYVVWHPIRQMKMKLTFKVSSSNLTIVWALHAYCSLILVWNKKLQTQHVLIWQNITTNSCSHISLVRAKCVVWLVGRCLCL